jgi:tetratricopeptide (TPR) repeat protein
MTESPDRDDRTIDVPPADSPSAVSFECAGAAGDTAALSSQTVEFTPAGQPVDLPAGRWPDLDGAAVSGQTVDLAGGLPGDDAEATPAVPARATAPPGYELVSVLGRGGMGVVYKARQVALKRLVALKMVTAGAHASPGDLIRFQTEAEAVASLQHPNIVQIYEVGEYEGVPYFSLEYVDGGSLVQKLKDRPLRSREAARLLQTLARAIHYAHEHGVVHRDIKPANVLLMADGTPKVADFGLAKRVGGDAEAASQTQAGTILGTPNFMAPEQAEGEIHEIGPTADVYSLGAVLYHLLTGRPPFQAATMLETLQLVRTKEPVPLRQLQPSVPRDLETICLKCLQKAPARRYASAAALADDLGRFLADEPILARPVGQVERVGRWCRRNPRAAALSATVAVLLVSVGVLAAVMATRAGRERAAVADAGNLARLRLDQAANAAAQGDARRALDILNAPDHRVETAPVLAELRGEWSGLRGQVAWLADFKQRIDKARYAGLFGAPAPTPGRATPAQRQALAETQRTCLRALEMCPANSAGNPKPQIPNPNGENSDSGFRIRDLEFPGAGPPQMDAAQEQLLREDVFDAYLVAGEVEWKLALAAGTPDAQRQAARRILDWLDRAGAVLPPTRTLHAKRAFYRSALGEAEAAQTEQDKAEAITPGTAVDHFWQGVVERLLGEADRARNDEKQAEQHYRRAAAAYVEVLRLRPDHFWGYFEWANCQFRLKAPQEALVALTAWTHIKPDAPWPYS